MRMPLFVKKHKSSILIKSAGRVDYLSLLRYSSGLIGNSSSGLVEAPALHKPSLNIGNRQSGRPLAKSVLSCDCSIKQITQSLKKIQAIKKNETIPYKGKNGIKKILKILEQRELEFIKSKKFYDINQEE